mgnify:FL=1
MDSSMNSGVKLMSSTDGQGSESEFNSPGWKLLDNRWLWFDGSQYTAEWDGSSVVPLPTYYWRNGTCYAATWDGSSWTAKPVPTRVKPNPKKIGLIIAAILLAIAGLNIMNQSM